MDESQPASRENRLACINMFLTAAELLGFDLESADISPIKFVNAFKEEHALEEGVVLSALNYYSDLVGTAEMIQDHRTDRSRICRVAYFLIDLSNPAEEFTKRRLFDESAMMLMYVDEPPARAWLASLDLRRLLTE